MRVDGIGGGWLYAVGDVNHRALLTHMGKYQARVCGEVTCARARGHFDAESSGEWSRLAASADHHAVPQVVFTDPEVAAVGLSADQARKRGLDVRVVDYDIGKVAGGHRQCAQCRRWGDTGRSCRGRNAPCGNDRGRGSSSHRSAPTRRACFSDNQRSLAAVTRGAGCAANLRNLSKKVPLVSDIKSCRKKATKTRPEELAPYKRGKASFTRFLRGP
jgi:hypothetical protein